MPTHSDAFDLMAMLASRGVDLASFGAAYLVLLATVLAGFAAFLAARAYLVISPNRSSRDYGTFVSAVLTTLLVATVLENELLPQSSTTLRYVAVPELLLLLVLHLAIARRQEPWLIALGGSALTGAVAVAAAAGVVTGAAGLAYWLTLALLACLLGFLWLRSVSTKGAFLSAKSIYVGSKETLDAAVVPQKPWLGLGQWVALAAASVLVAVLNAMLRGSGLEQIPAVDVAFESALLVGATAAVSAIPAASYWLARKTWMPELTRFAWLVWIVVGFAFTYGNYLNTLSRA